MKPQQWFQKEQPRRKPAPPPIAALAPASSEAGRIAARLRPHELVAMLTRHYARARARSLPRVKVSISVSTPSGRQAVLLACK